MPHPTPAVVGLDIAKNVFQVHGADATGHRVLRRRLRRGEVAAWTCPLGVEGWDQKVMRLGAW